MQSPRRSPQRKSSPRKSPRHIQTNPVRLSEEVSSIQGGGEKQLLTLQDNIEGSLADGSDVADVNTPSTSQFLTGFQSLQLSQKTIPTFTCPSQSTLEGTELSSRQHADNKRDTSKKEFSNKVVKLNRIFSLPAQKAYGTY